MAFFAFRLIRKAIQSAREKNADPEAQVRVATTGPNAQQRYLPERAHAVSALEMDKSPALLPQDPALEANWPRAKKLSHLVVNMLGLSLAIDFTMSLMSIQALYYVVGGSDRLYGLTFGSYDLTALCFAPIFGLWFDKTGRYKPQAAVGILASIGGNVMYGLTLLVGSWAMMLSGRLVAGVGAALMGVGSTYISSTTTMAVRTKHLARYRVWQSIARVLGPFTGYFFLNLPSYSPADPQTVLEVFNWYTISGWLAAFIVMVIGAVYLWLFTEPTHENGHLETHQDGAATVPEAERAEQKRGFYSFAAMFLPLVLLSQLLIWAYFSNLFALFAGQFHGVTQQVEQWKTFTAAGVGAVVGGLLYRSFARTGASIELPALAIAAFVMLPSWLLVIPYGGSTQILDTARFYAASGLCGGVVTVSAASQEALFSKKITQYASGVGDHMGKLLGTSFMIGSAGRFAGPLIAGAATLLATPSGVQQFCTGPVEEQCCIQANAYHVNGCVLRNVTSFYAAMAAVQGVLCVWSLLVLHKHGRYNTKGNTVNAVGGDN